jgi:FixJ family two-component response regulator
MSGRKLVEQLQAERPDLKVIFLSGYSGGTISHETGFLRRTRARFLQKPCHWHTLLHTLREALDEERVT